MALGGRAWRGYFPVGGELTSGKPDLKEGLYFGSELRADHPRVRGGTPLHGANLLPGRAGLARGRARLHGGGDAARPSRSMAGLALEPRARRGLLRASATPRDPLILFRIFNYPRVPAPTPRRLGRRRAHRLRLAHAPRQDDIGGLEVKTPERLGRCAAVAGRLRLQHRRHARSHDRRAVPLDAASACATLGARPAVVSVLLRPELRRARAAAAAALRPAPDDSATRWDHASVHAFDGTYGDYLLAKVSKVFPELRRETL